MKDKINFIDYIIRDLGYSINSFEYEFLLQRALFFVQSKNKAQLEVLVSDIAEYYL